MFGAKFENDKINILEGTREELAERGCPKAFDDREEAAEYGGLLRYRARKAELKELLRATPGRLSQLVHLVYGEDEDCIPGAYYAEAGFAMDREDALEAWERENGIVPPEPPTWPVFPEKHNEAGVTIGFCPRFENDTASVVSGTEDELQAMGCDMGKICASHAEALILARGMEVDSLLQEWENMDDYTSERAWELECRLFHGGNGCVPGTEIAQRMWYKRFQAAKQGRKTEG